MSAVDLFLVYQDGSNFEWLRNNGFEKSITDGVTRFGELEFGGMAEPGVQREYALFGGAGMFSGFEDDHSYSEYGVGAFRYLEACAATFVDKNEHAGLHASRQNTALPPVQSATIVRGNDLRHDVRRDVLHVIGGTGDRHRMSR